MNTRLLRPAELEEGQWTSTAPIAGTVSQQLRASPHVRAAEGIAIGEPMRGRQILVLAKKHGVRFVHAPERDIPRARANLAGYRQYVREFGPTQDCLITTARASVANWSVPSHSVLGRF